MRDSACEGSGGGRDREENGERTGKERNAAERGLESRKDRAARKRPGKRLRASDGREAKRGAEKWPKGR